MLQVAGQLVRQAESLSPEQQLANQREWLTTIAAQEGQLLNLTSIFDKPTPAMPPTAD